MGRKPIGERPMTGAERVRRSRAGLSGLPDNHSTNDIDALIAAGRRYAVILADPPWDWQTWSDKGKGRAAEQLYACMSIADIKALPVGDLAADDCALFLWASTPQLPESIEVMRAWGFDYKTIGFNWFKQTPTRTKLDFGLGYYNRSGSEICLLGTRGSPRRLPTRTTVMQVIHAARTTHSRKPDDAHYRIEKMIAGPYLELFARRPVMGWTVWGNQV